MREQTGALLVPGSRLAGNNGRDGSGPAGHGRARLLVRRRQHVADVADEAGVTRATLYRYYPNRQALVSALRDYALEETTAILEDAELDKAPVTGGIARVYRPLVANKSKHAALSQLLEHGLWRGDYKAVDSLLGGPVRTLVRRGLDEGLLRDDLSEDELIVLFGSLVQAAAHFVSEDRMGIERAAAIASSAFLGGTTRRRN